MAKTEKPKDPDYSVIIDELIKKIDNEKSLFTLFDTLGGYNWTLLVVLTLVAGAIVVALPDNFASLSVKLALFIALGAIIMTAIPELGGTEWQFNFIEANFRRAIKKFKIDENEEEKRFLLRALLKTKAMNPKSKLETAKKMHKDLFTKEKLLEKLYS
jgi:hypothetical protein